MQGVYCSGIREGLKDTGYWFGSDLVIVGIDIGGLIYRVRTKTGTVGG